MTNLISFTNLVKSSMALVFVAIIATASVANASAADVPSCTISATPATITNAQSATLKWISTDGAIFASLDNGIGSIAPDGEMIVSPNESTVYTMHTWNSQGAGGYCSVALTVSESGFIGGTGGPIIAQVQPTVTVQTLAVHPAATRVVLSTVPYTGPIEDAVYTFFLLALMLTAGYVATKQRKTVLG